MCGSRQVEPARWRLWITRTAVNRTLAYVWTTTGRLFNLDMISDGFAHEYTYDTPYRYQALFRAAEAEARAQDRGLWNTSTCPQ